MRLLTNIIYKGIRQPYLYILASKMKLVKLMTLSILPLMILSLINFVTIKGQIDNFHNQVTKMTTYIPNFVSNENGYELIPGEKALHYHSENTQLIIDIPQATSSDKSAQNISFNDIKLDNKLLSLALTQNTFMIHVGQQSYVINEPQNLFANDEEFKSILSLTDNTILISYLVLGVFLFLYHFLEFWLLVFICGLVSRLVDRWIVHNLTFKERNQILSVILMAPYVIFKIIQILLAYHSFPVIVLILIGTLTFHRALISSIEANQALSEHFQKMLQHTPVPYQKIQNDKDYRKAEKTLMKEKNHHKQLTTAAESETDKEKLEYLHLKIQQSEALIYFITKQLQQYDHKDKQDQ